MSFRRIVIRSAIAATVAAAVLAGGPAAYFHHQVTKADELFDWNSAIEADERHPQALRDDAAVMLSIAHQRGEENRERRQVALWIALGAPVAAWVLAGALLWIARRPEDQGKDAAAGNTQGNGGSPEERI